MLQCNDPFRQLRSVFLLFYFILWYFSYYCIFIVSILCLVVIFV